MNEVVAEFAARHVLTSVLAQRLHALLQGVLQRQQKTKTKISDLKIQNITAKKEN